MALVNSQSTKEAVRLSDKIAKEDITVTNINGQNVLVVAKGSPEPADLEAAKDFARQGAIVQAEEKAVDPVENKSKAPAKSKAKK